MIAIMTDHDMEEKRLLNALDDPYNHYNPHSLCYDNNRQQSHYRGSDYYNHGPDHYHSPYQRQYFEPRTDDRHHYRHHHYHRHHRRVSDQNQAATVSMSTEEDLLSDIDLFEGSQSELHINPVNEHGMVFPAENAQNTIHDEMKPAHSPKVPRRITLEDDDAAANNSNDAATPLPLEERPEQTQSPKVSPRRKSTKRRKNNRENPEPFKVDTPTKPDILCGQSRVCASHPGNRRFQAVLDDFLYRYDIATSKQEKMCMTKEVVSIIHADGGRFLKYKDGMWEEISTVAARDKVSHALRTKVASWKKQKQMMEGANDAPLGTSGRSSKFREQRRASSRRSSTASDIASVSFDGSDPASKSVVSGLMKAQQEFFANLTSDPRPDDEAPAFRASLSDGEDNDEQEESFAPPRRSSSRF